MSGAPTRQPGYPARIGVALVDVAAADFLLYGQPVGLSLLVLFALVGATVLAIHPTALVRNQLAKLGLLFAGLVPLAENVSALSVSIAMICLSAFALSVADRLSARPARARNAILAFLLVAPFRLIRDFFRWRRTARRLGRRRMRFAALAVWIMPLCLGVVFMALFGAANPVIDYWLSLIDLWKLLDLIALGRLVFWILALACIWALLRPRLPYFFRRVPRAPGIMLAGKPVARSPDGDQVGAEQGNTVQASVVQTFEDVVFGKAAILRALIVFNLMFAVQTALDATYLWGGAALPDGMTYASYAHRGAYPLIVTALLAAGFVLAALKPGSATSDDRPIRRLVYLWVAQNILLVISSIFRLDLYVGIYALTYWRIAAFIWMGLVAVGLALIIARIILRKSNQWLLSANLLALSATLYACSFINFAALIARYNVEHSFEMTRQGVPLDTRYMRELGPAAFPAIDSFLSGREPSVDPVLADLAELRAEDERWYRACMKNWRAWTFRDWRLIRYLDSRPPAPRPPSPAY
jgi:hypothetical protein